MKKGEVGTFLVRLKAAREKLHLSQAEAAKLWGFPKQTVNAWESGKRNPTGLYREKLERVLRRVLGD